VTVTFRPDSIALELRGLSESARPFLETNDHQLLATSAVELENWFAGSRPGPFVWTLGRPVRTDPSTSYQGQGNAHAVSAGFTFSWNCERTDDPNLIVARNGGSNVTIYRGPRPVTHYHYDLCPGGQTHSQSPIMHCFSHSQFKGGTSFPRFPSIFLLPSDVLEMLLFELWPEDWANEAEINRNKLLRHHLAQRRRALSMTGAFRQLMHQRFPLVSLHAILSDPVRLS
jgi:hypothetical protein